MILIQESILTELWNIGKNLLGYLVERYCNWAKVATLKISLSNSESSLIYSRFAKASLPLKKSSPLISSKRWLDEKASWSFSSIRYSVSKVYVSVTVGSFTNRFSKSFKKAWLCSSWQMALILANGAWDFTLFKSCLWVSFEAFFRHHDAIKAWADTKSSITPWADLTFLIFFTLGSSSEFNSLGGGGHSVINSIFTIYTQTASRYIVWRKCFDLLSEGILLESPNLIQAGCFLPESYGVILKCQFCPRVSVLQSRLSLFTNFSGVRMLRWDEYENNFKASKSAENCECKAESRWLINYLGHILNCFSNKKERLSAHLNFIGWLGRLNENQRCLDLKFEPSLAKLAIWLDRAVEKFRIESKIKAKEAALHWSSRPTCQVNICLWTSITLADHSTCQFTISVTVPVVFIFSNWTY